MWYFETLNLFPACGVGNITMEENFLLKCFYYVINVFLWRNKNLVKRCL
jgi:hypothetical protein